MEQQKLAKIIAKVVVMICASTVMGAVYRTEKRVQEHIDEIYEERTKQEQPES